MSTLTNIQSLCASTLIALSVPAHAGNTATSQVVPKAQKAKASHAYQTRTIQILKWLPTKEHQGVYATGKLAGSKVSDLYAWYLGRSGTLPKNIRVDWNRQLARLWTHKFTLTQNKPVLDTGTMLVLEYSRLDPERMSLGEYQAIAEKQSRIVYTSLRWEKVGIMYFANPKTKTVNIRKVALLKRVARNIRGRTLIAYAMTELFPTSGNYSQAYLDFLLRNAGRRYVESLPALHDPLTSFGPFQFTSKAVFATGSDAVGGASRMNTALPAHLRIPSSVSLLRGNAHLRAAELFAISNLASFIRKLNDKQIAQFERIVETKSLDLAQFVATAHNKPTVAYAAGIRWLNAKALSSYGHRCPKASKQYAHKTSENYQALASL